MPLPTDPPWWERNLKEKGHSLSLSILGKSQRGHFAGEMKSPDVLAEKMRWELNK